MNLGIRIILGMMTVVGLLSSPLAAQEEAKEGVRNKLLEDESLLFFVPFDFSVDAEKAWHRREGKLGGEGEFVPGVVGNSLSLPAEGKGSVGYAISDNINMEKGTLMFWFRPYWWGTDIENRYTLFVIWMERRGAYFTFHRSFSAKHPTLLYAIGEPGLGGGSIHTVRDFRRNEWIHLAATWDAEANRFFLYLNGKARISAAPWRKSVLEEGGWIPRRLSLGASHWAGPINAAYDEFFIFERVLTEEEIRSYYQETKPE